MRFICITILPLAILSLLLMIASVSAEKTPVSLTIASLPETQVFDKAFHVTGILSTGSGDPLGNKRVTLESSRVSSAGPGNYSFIALGATNREGKYDFIRPKQSPPEYLRVTYAGSELYEAAVSPVLPVRGVGTDNPQFVHGTGSLTVNTDPAGAGIFIDSEYKGVTPSVLQNMDEGAHHVGVSLEGYQNETMEVYISPNRGATYSISLTPEGQIRRESGISSHLSFAPNETVSFGDPVFSLENSGISMSLHANGSGVASSTTDKGITVTTVVSEDAIGKGSDVMVIMTDH